MEKNLRRKFRQIQTKYPAAYSQSWSNSDPLENVSDTVKKSLSHSKRSKIPQTQYGCCWKQPKPLKRGCDPYAPHLKYGLFPRKVIQDLSKTNSSKAPLRKKRSSEEIKYNNMINRYNREMKKTSIKDALLFRVRPLDKQYKRQLQLSMSEMTHVDIKPRKHVLKHLSPTISLSQTKTCSRLIRNKRY